MLKVKSVELLAKDSSDLGDNTNVSEFSWSKIKYVWIIIKHGAINSRSYNYQQNENQRF